MEQARSEYLGKLPKIQTALEATFVDDLHKIAAAERAAVNQYRKDSVFEGKQPAGGPPENGELIVADDVQINQGATWQTIASVAIPAVAALLGYQWLASKPAPAAAAPVEIVDTDTRYRIEMLPGE